MSFLFVCLYFIGRVLCWGTVGVVGELGGGRRSPEVSIALLFRLGFSSAAVSTFCLTCIFSFGVHCHGSLRTTDASCASGDEKMSNRQTQIPASLSVRREKLERTRKTSL